MRLCQILISAKICRFYFEVYEINGNDMEQVVDVLDRAENVIPENPMHLADTVKGQAFHIWKISVLAW